MPAFFIPNVLKRPSMNVMQAIRRRSRVIKVSSVYPLNVKRNVDAGGKMLKDVKLASDTFESE